MKVNIEDVLKMQEFRNSINQKNIYDIEWYQDGKKLDMDKAILDEWKFIGLNNTDFITRGFYNGTCDSITEIYISKDVATQRQDNNTNEQDN